MYERDGTTPGPTPGTETPKVTRRWVGDPTVPAPAPDSRLGPKPEYKSDPSWDKLLLIVGAIVVVVGLLVVPGILNRGGNNPVADAAEATSTAPGVRFTFTGEAQGPVAMSMSGNGLMNGETKRLSLDMSATATTATGTQGFNLREVVDDGDLYLSSPELGAAFGGSARWLLVRSEALGSLLQADASGGGLSTSPTQQLDALEDASYQVSEIGRERVNGVSATHYTALLDIGKITDQLKEQVSGQFGELVEKSMDEISSATVDVWIDEQGLLRRETSTTSSGPLGRFTMTMDFTDYGVRPNIQVPSSGVYDVTPLMEKVLDELGG